MKYILMMILLVLPVQAHADWSAPGMRPVQAPNFSPNQGQPIQHEVHVNAPPVHVEPQYRVPVVSQPQPARHDQPVDHRKAPERHEPAMPTYFRHDVKYYGHVDVILPYADVDSPFVVPDGFETVMVNGETFYYNQGVFYQQVGDQLTAIPAVLGAVVDNIPEDYQIVMADGVHYLFTGGVYYQRVDQGFEVVEAPGVEDA